MLRILLMLVLALSTLAVPARSQTTQRPGHYLFVWSQDRDEAGLGRTVRGLKVTADGIADYVERVVTRFLDDRDAAADETFAQWAHRADEEALR